MKILHSNSDYAAISSIDELRAVRRKLRLRILRSERNLDLRSRQMLSLDSVVSSIAPRLALIKQSVISMVDVYSAIRDYIRSCRQKKENEKNEAIDSTATSSEAE